MNFKKIDFVCNVLHLQNESCDYIILKNQIIGLVGNVINKDKSYKITFKIKENNNFFLAVINFDNEKTYYETLDKLMNWL